MNVLIIEDDPKKSKQLADFARQHCGPNVVETRSFHSGLDRLTNAKWDVVLLDMTLPNYDVSFGEDGGRIRTYGGIDILDEIDRLRLSVKIIVVTQYPSFGEGSEKMTLDEVARKLSNEYPGYYSGTVYYHPSQSDWKIKLANLIDDLLSQRGRL